MVESEDLFALADAARLQRYREFAEEAVRQAERARSAEIRAGYLRLAGHWQEIAMLLERAMRLKGQSLVPKWQPAARAPSPEDNPDK